MDFASQMIISRLNYLSKTLFNIESSYKIPLFFQTADNRKERLMKIFHDPDRWISERVRF